MGESGLSAAEVGKEIAEHRHHTVEHGGESTGRDRRITIIEAVLLAVVAVLAAWSGFAAAKWGTEAQLTLARAAASRTEASRANLSAMESRNFDASTFNAWFIAYTSGNQAAMAVAERRFRPEFKAAFDAWMVTNPFTSTDSPPGPTYMAEYIQPDAERAKELDARGDELYAEGAHAGATADDYVRTTVLLASVLFLVGISGHFRVRAARYGLVAVGGAIMATSLVIVLLSPKPPA
ncbi:MAG TPA: hypothetical protein VIJ47_09595 [Acidimicrobiales bacterium]